jgi:HSP20 family protein
MAIKDLIPWNSNKGREVGFQRGADTYPLFAFHREMNRMFDDVLRGFDLASFDSDSGNGLGWPQIDIDETEKEVRITAELPGLEEKDVSLEIANGVLSISGEKKTDLGDKARRFSERYYGRFERRIPLQDVEEAKASAAFKNGVLTVTVPKSTASRSIETADASRCRAFNRRTPGRRPRGLRAIGEAPSKPRAC